VPPRARDRLLAPLLLALAGCSIELPHGKLVCRADTDCPRGWRCVPPEAAEGRCYPAGAAGGPDAALADPAPDAGSTAPTSPDELPMDASAPAPTPSDAESGSADAAMPAPALPDHIRLPGPECGKEPEPTAGIFTSAGVGVDLQNCGGSSGPCRTLQKALDRASQNRLSYVYLDNTESYTVSETLSLPANVTVMGGFSNVNGRWARLCADARSGSARIVSTANPALVASYDGYSKLDSLSIEGRKAQAGESLYGIVARGDKTRLWLRDVVVTAADGGDGNPGAAGITPPVAAMSCVPEDGASAMLEGAPGAGGRSGTFTLEGYQPASGADGSDGARGHAGTVAPAPVCASCVPDAGNYCLCSPASQSCGMPGEVGCGGNGGTGGRGGQGGGSSIALFSWDAVVDIAGGRLSAGRGGDGGEGGGPGAGSPGLPGKKGAPGASCMLCVDVPEGCFATGETYSGDGTSGGNGGAGSAGGRGGAGSGGVAHSLYRNAKSALTLAADTRLEHGRAGRGPAGAAQGKAAPLGP
jgi:hypothetical protein